MRATCALGFATIAFVFIASLPDFGSLEGPAFLSMAFSVGLTALAKWRGLPRDEVQWAAFEGIYCGTGLGLVVLAVGVMTGLY